MERKNNFGKKLLLILIALVLALQTPAGVLAAEAGKEDTQTQEAGITAAAQKKGWVETADGTYYFYKKGKMATGWRTIDGKK